MANVTSGQELNSYRGDANLAGGPDNTGYAKIDLSPLQTYAVQRYNTNLIDADTQRKDRLKLEEQYNNPDLYVSLDKGLADQIDPLLTEFKELGKKNLELNPRSDDWYKFKDLNNKIIKFNAKAKTVQDLKDKYKGLAESTANPHEKENINAYVSKLDGYKIGDEVPVYNKYFDFDSKHLPVGDVVSTKIKRLTPDGKNLEEVEYTANNPIDLDKKARLDFLKNPDMATSAADLAHNLLHQDPGTLEDLNAKAKETQDLGIRLNMKLLQDKYQAPFKEFQKENPTGTFQEFLKAKGLSNEYDNIINGHKYLNDPDKGGGIQYIAAKPGEQLTGYTYSNDGKFRLNVPDEDLLAIYSATNKPVQSEKVLKTDTAIDPEKEAERLNRLKIENLGNASAERINANTQKHEDARARLPYDEIKLTNEKNAKTVAQNDYSPFASIIASVGGVNKAVPLSNLSTAQVGAINNSYVTKDGTLTDEAAKMKISVGMNKKGNYGVYLIDDNGKAVGNVINESALAANGASWLTTFGKETKGQDAYKFVPEVFTKSLANNEQSNAVPSTTLKPAKSKDFYMNEANSTKVDAAGNVTFTDGTIWKYVNGQMIQIK